VEQFIGLSFVQMGETKDPRLKGKKRNQGKEKSFYNCFSQKGGYISKAKT